MDTLTSLLVRELYHAAALLGAQSDLLSVIGSWGETIPDNQTLELLRAWNDAKANGLRHCLLVLRDSRAKQTNDQR